jgi:hypothetical protein
MPVLTGCSQKDHDLFDPYRITRAAVLKIGAGLFAAQSGEAH